MMMCYAIPATKANRLYWLGRYAERVYISLHLLRRYYDDMIDGDTDNRQEYYRNLKIADDSDSAGREEFRLSQMYDPSNPCSILSGLERANDNAIVLREEIKSESLSYIQLSLCLIKQCAARRENNITALQPITDYLLAFFGSIDERVFNERIRGIIKTGRLIENIDMHVRFNYPFFRIEEAYLSLKACAEAECRFFDADSLQQIDEAMTPEKYSDLDDKGKDYLLNLINRLVQL